MTPFARQLAALQITEDEALEGWRYWQRTRGDAAMKFIDYDRARLDVLIVYDLLAILEGVHGTDAVLEWIRGAVAKAESIRQQRDATP